MPKCICKLVFLPTKPDIKPNKTEWPNPLEKQPGEVLQINPWWIWGWGRNLPWYTEEPRVLLSTAFRLDVVELNSNTLLLTCFPSPLHVPLCQKGPCCFPKSLKSCCCPSLRRDCSVEGRWLAQLCSGWPWCRDNPWPVIFSSIGTSWDSPQLGRDYCGVLSLCITQLISLPAAALYSPAVTISLMTTSSTDLSPQIPSSIVSHYLLGLTKANTFSLHCLPSSHSSPSPSFPFFLAAPCLPKAFPMLFYRLIYHAAAIICRIAFHCIIPELDAFISPQSQLGKLLWTDD